MKTGRTLVSLAQEVEALASLKRDFVASTSALSFMGDGPHLGLEDQKGAVELFGMTDNLHRQVSTNLKIPAVYYDRIRHEHPDLLIHTVNTFFHRNPQKRMVRVLGDNARAFLSPRYRRLDHIDLMEHILPELVGKDLKVVSCEITESKLYLKFTSTEIQGEVKKGDIVEAGGIVGNSEIGHGSVNVFPFLNRLACLNGMVINEFGQRRYHVGREIESEEDAAMEIYADDTLKAEDEAFWRKIRDTVRAVVDQTQFDKLLTRLRETSEQKIEGKPEAVVTLLANRYQLNEGQRDSILRHLVDDGVGFSAYGLANAVTSVASEQESYDEATRLEATGGAIITLPANQWKELSRAA